MKKEEVIEILKQYREVSQKMLANDLSISIQDGTTYHHVDDRKLVELSELFNKKIELETINHIDKDYTVANLDLGDFGFYCWDFSWALAEKLKD